MPARPYFSIVIPMFNREKEIRRAVESCLTQEFRDFEVLVTDDGSTDRSAEMIESIRDRRIHLLRHATNRGVCPARNTGVMAASGAWIVLLDSDDELRPGALLRMAEIARTLAPSVQRMAFMYQRDDGRISPEPAPQEGTVGYREWLRFVDQARLFDLLSVTRRETFQSHLFANTRVAEVFYQLEFASKHPTVFVPEVLGLVHTDSSNRLSSVEGGETRAERRQRAHDRAADLAQVLAYHGTSLRRFAPAFHRNACFGLLVQYVIAGSRFRAATWALRNLAMYPTAGRSWAGLGLVFAGKRAAQFLRSYKTARDRHRNATVWQEARVSGVPCHNR